MQAVTSTSWKYVTTRDEFVEACGLLAAYIKTPEAKLAVDLETYIPKEAFETACRLQNRKDPVPKPIWEGRFWLGHARLITVGTHPYLAPADIRAKQFIFDTHALGQEWITAGLKPILENCTSIGHNYKYDYSFLKAQYGITIPRHLGKCTQLLNLTLRSGQNHYGNKLYELYQQHIQEGFFTSVTGKTFEQYVQFKESQQLSDWSLPVLEFDQLKYAAEDAFLIFYCYEKQLQLLQDWVSAKETHMPANQSLAHIAALECKLLGITSMIELRGAPFDKDRHSNLVIPLLTAKREEYKLAVTQLPEFQVIPEVGTSKILLKMDYLVDKPGMPVPKTASEIRKILHKLYKGVDYSPACLSSEDRNRLFTDFLSKTPKSYKGEPEELATKKLAEYENELKRPFFVWTNDAIDGAEIHILWRANTNPSFSREQILDLIKDVVPSEYHVFPYEPINLNSPDQLGRALFKRFGEPVEDTGAETLKQYMESDPDAVSALINYKNAKDMASRYGEGLVLCTTSRNRIHTNYNQYGAETGRMSSSGPALQQIPARQNLFLSQQFPKGISATKLFRESFSVPDGYVFIDADFSQIEPRITAEFTRDARYIQALVNKEDLHSLTVFACLGEEMGWTRPPDKNGTDDEKFWRDVVGKTINLAMSYGQGANGLADSLFKSTDGRINWNREKAQNAIDNYFELYPGIKAKVEEVRRFIQQEPARYGSLAPFKGHRVFASCIATCGRVRHFQLTSKQEKLPDVMLAADYNPQGRRYFFNEFKSRMNDCSLQGYNFYIQGHAATVFKKSVLYVEERMERELDLDPWTEGIVLMVHDEIGMLIRKQYADQASVIMQEEMERAAKETITVVPCSIGIKQGRNWAETH